MKGYKATDKEGKCKGFQFEVGKTYDHEGEFKICYSGFHFCHNLFDVYNYYDKSEFTRIFEVDAIGEISTELDKSCTNKITIIRELSDREILKAWINRTNSGDYNSGDYNSGYYNSGDYNSGDYNSGYYNSRNRNSGNFNSGDYNSGDFNTHTPFVILFNKKTKLSFNDCSIVKLRNISFKVKPILQWVSEPMMTEDEKSKFPSYKTTGGFLKKTDRNDYSAWNNKTDLDFLKSLPNFDAAIFKEITGIDVK